MTGVGPPNDWVARHEIEREAARLRAEAAKEEHERFLGIQSDVRFRSRTMRWYWWRGFTIGWLWGAMMVAVALVWLGWLT